MHNAINKVKNKRLSLIYACRHWDNCHSSTSSCPTYGRSQHLRDTVSLSLLGQQSLLPPSGAWGHEDWQAVKGVLCKEMATIGEYLQTWKLKFSTTKTESGTFHLNNKKAKLELNVNILQQGDPALRPQTKYLGVTLDRSLTYRRRLESLRKKLTSRAALLRRLADSGRVLE